MKDRPFLLPILMTWTIFTASFPTILFYRAATQPTYQWGLFGMTGEGLSLGYLVILVATAYAWGTIVVGMRQRYRTFGVLLVIWNAFLLTTMVRGVLQFGSAMSIRGDAMGLRINIAILGPALCGAFLLLSLWSLFRIWSVRSDVRETHWPKSARLTLGAALLLGPLIAALFVAGDGVDHTDLDRLAIGLVIAQCILIPFALGNREPIGAGRDTAAT